MRNIIKLTILNIRLIFFSYLFKKTDFINKIILLKLFIKYHVCFVDYILKYRQTTKLNALFMILITIQPNKTKIKQHLQIVYSK